MMKDPVIKETREQLYRILNDPESGAILNSPILFQRQTLAPEAYYSKQFIQLVHLLQHERIVAVWPAVLSASLREVQSAIHFDSIIIDPQFSREFWPSHTGTEINNISTWDLNSDYALPADASLNGHRVLFITGIIQTGNILQGIANMVEAKSGLLVGAMCVVLTSMPSNTEGELGQNLSSLSRQTLHGVQVFSLLNHPIKTVKSLDEFGYEPIYVRLASSPTICQPTIITVNDVNEELKRYLSIHPQILYDLSSRKFEEVIASILEDIGFEVELTRATRDGGKDILAYLRNDTCSFLTYVECKQYSPQQKVGVEVVRSVYGVQAMHRANKSLIVTTSFFSKPAVEEARIIEPQMELKDYEAIKRWLQRYS